MKVDQFRATNAKVSNDFGSIRDQFMDRIKQCLDNPSKIIFTEDVKNVLYLANREDLPLLKPLLSKYVKQAESDESFSKYSFGPLIARLLYVHHSVDLALELISDPELKPLFNSLNAYVTACDLLFKEGKYNDVISLIENDLQKTYPPEKFPSDASLLYAAACCKIGTEEALNKLLKFINDNSARGSIQSRVYTFLAVLSLKHGKAAVAYEKYPLVKARTSTIGLNAHLKLQLELELYEDALVFLQSFVERLAQRTSRNRPPFLVQSIFDQLCEDINSKGNDDLKNRLKDLSNRIVSLNCLDSKTLEEVAFIQVEYLRNRNTNNMQENRYDPRGDDRRRFGQGGYDNRSSDPRVRYNDQQRNFDRPFGRRERGGYGGRSFDGPDRRFDDRSDDRFERFDRSDDRFDRSDRSRYRHREFGGSRDE